MEKKLIQLLIMLPVLLIAVCYHLHSSAHEEVEQHVKELASNKEQNY